MQIQHQTIIGERPGPHLLILGGVHGDEYEPIAAIRQLSNTIRSSQLSGQVTLVPVVNEPAFASISRTGPDGLDLARTFPGRETGSVTEQIAFQTAQLIRGCNFLIDLHTGGLAARIAPLAGYMLHADLEVREQQKRMAQAFNLPVIWGTNSKLDGRTLSVARDAHIPAIYAEWGGGGGCDPRGVADYVQGCLNVMHLLGMVEQIRPENRVQFFVEDFREESGVLQKNYPAERPGYFEPACRLHDQVKPGDVLGWIHPLNQEPALPVKSMQQGIVILLRAIPAVKPGDFLAVILEADGSGEFRHE